LAPPRSALVPYSTLFRSVAAMAVGVAKAALDRSWAILKEYGLQPQYRHDLKNTSHLEAQLYRFEADWEAARLLTLKAAWMADNRSEEHTSELQSRENLVC